MRPALHLDRCFLGACVAALLLLPPTTSHADKTPGRRPEDGKTFENVPDKLLQSLSGAYAATGRISLSIDGAGVSGPTGQVQVRKPAGGTLRAAFLAAATTGFSNATIPVGALKLNGVPVDWATSQPNAIGSRNYLADVTSLLAPTLNAAPAGLTTIAVFEGGSSPLIDGSILAVIFDDPAETRERTVSLFFGAQDIDGDAFNIGLAEPARPLDPEYVLDMSLGISYGFQDPITANQISVITVNGHRMTSSAGGQDDGESSDGALLTVGGLGDSNTDPADPDSPPANARYDDELYDLRAFVAAGDLQIHVTTLNPSRDDNVFFAALLMSGSAIVNEGILLTPHSGLDPVGQTHTVIGTLQNAAGDRVTNRAVDFLVTEGPHAGAHATALTDQAGQATFSYRGIEPGLDRIEASFVNGGGTVVVSAAVTEEWVRAQACPDCPPAVGGEVIAGHAFSLGFSFCNCGPVADTFTWCVTDELGWLPAGCDSALVPAGGCASPTVGGLVPMKLAADDTNRFTFVLTCRTNPARRDTCVVSLPVRPPTLAVVLADLEATSGPDGVRLTWTTARETEHAFFNVYRAEDGSGAFVKLNGGPILGDGRYTFLDPVPPRDAVYRVEAIDRQGNAQLAGETRVTTAGAPPLLRLAQNEPNPFAASTTLRLELRDAAPARLQVFDAAGRLVRTLLDRGLAAGPTTTTWDARDDVNRRVPAGLYFVRAQSAGFQRTIRILLTR